MDISFSCTGCGQHIVVDAAGAGLSITCPSCSCELTVPAPPSPAGNSQPQSKKRGRKSIFSQLTKETIFEKNSEGETRLYQAIRKKKFAEIPREALSEEIFLVQNRIGRTPLHFAAQYGCIDQIPREFLTHRTLSVRNSGGSTPIHAAALAGHMDQFPKEVLTKDLMEMRNNSGATPIEWKPQPQSSRESGSQEPATEKQKAYLSNLGVAFTESQLTKERASDLIEDALSKRPPTQRQIDKLRRLGLLDELDEDDTALDASGLLEGILDDKPTEIQVARAKELGFRLTKIDELTAGYLDDILKLADRQPDREALNELRACGFANFSGTALEAQMILELVGAYNELEWDLDRVEIAAACVAAMKDPSFCKPTIEGGSLTENFHWPNTKMQEWVRQGKPMVRQPPRAQSRTAPRGKGCLVAVVLVIGAVLTVTSVIAALLRSHF